MLLLLFAITLLYQVRYTTDVFRREKVDAPLVLAESASNVIGFANAAATRSGVRVGDRLLEVDGIPYTGSGVLGQALAGTQVGGQVALKVDRGAGVPAAEFCWCLQTGDVISANRGRESNRGSEQERPLQVVFHDS